MLCCTSSTLACNARKERNAAMASFFWGCPRSLMTDCNRDSNVMEPFPSGSKVSYQPAGLKLSMSKSCKSCWTSGSPMMPTNSFSVTSMVATAASSNSRLSSSSNSRLPGFFAHGNQALWIGSCWDLAGDIEPRAADLFSANTRCMRCLNFRCTYFRAYCCSCLRLTSECFKPLVVESTKIAVTMLKNPKTTMIIQTTNTASNLYPYPWLKATIKDLPPLVL
mmetsp:Transcript_77218/g.236304  ORF Transcript_77218/g.236304 Transcript_77218/m.236304 type:complete len:222 (-) Transcript_77218:856-1521(-)